MIDDTFELEAIRSAAVLDGEPDPDRRLTAHRQLMSLIRAETVAPRRGRRQRKATRVVRRAVAAWSVGALSGLAAAVITAVILIGHGGAVQPPSAAAAVLDRAAKAPAIVSPLHLGPHQVWYVEDVSATQSQQGANNPRTCKVGCYNIHAVRWWVGARSYSMHTYLIAHSAKPMTVTKAPPNVPMTPAPNSVRWSGVGAGYDQILHYNLMLTVATDLRSLRKLMAHPLPPTVRVPPNFSSQPRWSKEQMIFENITGILLQPRVPARMLSGLYRLLATMPGVRFEGRVTDTLGRPALKVAYKFPEAPGSKTHTEVALLFDPTSYVLLDTISTATGKYPYYADLAFVRSGLVHRIGALPNNADTRWVFSSSA